LLEKLGSAPVVLRLLIKKGGGKEEFLEWVRVGDSEWKKISS
jgi:hypothetical protein